MAEQRIRPVDMAAALGTTRATMSRKLNGDTPFTVDELDRVAEVLGLTLTDLARATEAGSTPLPLGVVGEVERDARVSPAHQR